MDGFNRAKVFIYANIKEQCHKIIEHICFSINGVKNSVNPYKPSVPFVGLRQTVQTQIRRRTMRRLVRISTICSHSAHKKIDSMRNATEQPVKRKWTDPFDKDEKIHSN